MIKGIELGSDISSFPALVFIGDIGGGKKVYRMGGGNTKIGDADIETIMYGFYKDRLEDMQIHFCSFSNFAKLKEKLFQLCGAGRQPIPFAETYHWYGRKFSCCLTYNREAEKGVIGYTFLPIYWERREDMKLGMVNSWLALLEETERAVITLRFGFNGRDALTVESTAECLGLSPEEVRQIEGDAVKKLQKISLKEDDVAI
jgi:hypothetical protein